MPELGKLWYSLNLKTKDFEKAAEDLKKKVEALGGNITIKGVSFDKHTKRDAQNQLDNIEGLKVGVNIQLHTNTLQAQLDRIKSNLTLNNSNVGGSGTTNNAPLNERVRVQERINRRATDELGIRRSINDQMSRNTQLATMFGNAIGNVFATYQIQRFLEALVHVGGEIQKQRMALGHIIGNEAEAMTLFEQMKGLAVKSPFGLLDLMQNARQLSAFGVQYNSLYDTMRRLSDVAAGLGIQFGRLSLAYGETMERGFLDGKLVRQFSYMGLPVLQKIAQYYTEINKAGNGQIFSATDVRKMVSNREVSFEDVDAVIKKMTDEGGQFANMQEVMAESVAGKWKNVADAIDIMYSNMVEGNSEILKAPAELLITLTRNYDALIPVLGAVGGAMLGTKAVAMLFNATMGKQVALTYQSMIAEQKQVVVERQRKAALEGASIAEIRRLRATGMLSEMQLTELVVEGKLNAEDAKAIVLKQGVTMANLDALQSFGLITIAEKEQILASTGLNRSWLMMQARMKLLGIQAKMVAASFVEMTVAMMANPMTWVFAAVAAFMELGHVISKAGDRAEESNQKMRQNMQELAGDVKEIKQRVTISYDVVYSDGTKANEAGAEWAKKIWDENPDKSLSFGGKPMVKKYTATYAEIQTAIDELVKFIKDHVPGAQAILDEAFATDSNNDYVNSLEERYEILKKVYDKFASIGENSSLVNGLQDSLGENYHWYERWWHALGSDDLLTDASDYEKEFNNVMDTLNDLYANGSDEYREMVNEWMKKMDAKNADDLFKKLLAPENFKELLAFQNQSRKKINILDWMGLDFDIGNFTDAVSEYTEELDDAWAKLDKQLKAHNLDPNNKDQKQEIQYYVRAWLDSTDASEWVKEHMTSDFQTRWGIDISLSGDVEKARDLLKEKWGTSAKGSYAETFEQGYTDYKDNVKKLQKLEGTILKNISKVNGKYVKGQPDQKEVADAIDEANGYITKIEELQRNAKSVGMDFAADWKKEQDKKTTNKGGNKTDEQLKAWKEQFDELKKAYSEYSKWEAKVGKENAGKKVAELGLINEDLLKSLGIDSKQLGSAEGYKKAVETFLRKIEGQLASSAERKKLKTNIKAEIGNIELSIEDEALRKAQEKAQREINNAAKQWDIYKIWFEATGNKEQAFKMSLQIVPIMDEHANDLEKQLKDTIGSVFNQLDFSRNASMIDMKKIFDDADLSDQFDKYKTLYDLMWKNGEDASKNIANALKDLQTGADKIAVIEEKYRKLIEADQKATGGKNVSKLKGARDSEILPLTNSYIQYMQLSLTLSKQAMKQLGDSLKNELTDKLKNGKITADKYAKEIKKINDEQRKFNKAQRGSGSFGMKTFNEMIDSLTNKGSQQIEQGARTIEQGNAQYKEAMQNMDFNGMFNATALQQSGESMMTAGENMMAGAESAEGAIAIVDMIIKGINQAVQALNQSVQYIDEMLESLGTDTGADTNWGQAKAYISGFAESSQHAADSWENFKSGNFAGMVADQIGSVTSIVTNFNKLHDAKLQAQIDKMNLQNDTLNNIYDELKTALERTLGGIYKLELDDATRKQLENITKNIREYDDTDNAKYSNETKQQAQKALDSNSYYQAQLANLMAQRDNLQSMYNAENGKKDTDYGTLEDFRSQIADIQDQIAYFAEDLAKELYGIDFKDWASQLTDSLVEAWANGEDAAKAYEDTVKDIMKSVTKSVISQSIIEAALEPVLKNFKEKFVQADGQLDMSQISYLASSLNTLYPQLNEAVVKYLEEVKSLGTDLGSTDGTSTTSSSIKSISEETADILAAYINGMRLDLSLQRLAVERIAEKYCGEEGSEDESGMIAQAQLQQLQQIASNTQRNAEAAEAMRETLDAVVAGTKSWSIQ